jgi:hypothetical protein
MHYSYILSLKLHVTAIFNVGLTRVNTFLYQGLQLLHEYYLNGKWQQNSDDFLLLYYDCNKFFLLQFFSSELSDFRVLFSYLQKRHWVEPRCVVNFNYAGQSTILPLVP